MQSHSLSVGCRSVLSIFAAILIGCGIASSQEKVLANFYDNGGEVLPHGAVTIDAAGNLYGTTFYGGLYDQGIVFKLSPTAHGYKATTLHNFIANAIDGFGAMSGVIMDSAGNLYGATEFGGNGECTAGFGCGTVFKLSPASDGSWTETILHNFQGYDGWQSYGALTWDSKGNLYGTTANGGLYDAGTVYELSPKGASWTLKTLYNFAGGSDSSVPWNAVIFDAKGNLYGTASQGGGSSSACPYGCGTVFELSPSESGWTETILHNFTTDASDGNYPSQALVFDSAGNLYGTTSQGGGTLGSGIVFQLTPGSDGWTENVLHNFNDSSTDGIGPSSTLLFDASGNLYGTTLVGGTHGEGIVFQLAPDSGAWTENILHNFKRDNDGNWPTGLAMAPDGNLFGSTGFGGHYGDGTVFEVTP
ncbi:MAG TPA: choice-of-anchor tandem repeat GloVer-containing protein [Candidatus Sulfotelmatobacter sp.]|nr:choice-of-anchor tandem repeat GloVer-containing protein [Candidatus Sulfotelmatobacter sp.]